MLKGVFPQPFHPTSPGAPEPAAANDRATALANATRTRGDALARLIPRKSYPVERAEDRARLRMCDRERRVELRRRLPHEMGGGVHAQVEDVHLGRRDAQHI